MAIGLLVASSEDIDFKVCEQSKQTIDESLSRDRHIYSMNGQLSRR
jgi:hypothetical protein